MKPLTETRFDLALSGSVALERMCDQLLDSMSIVEFKSTYFVGPFTRGVSFASQQVRALNLVWAMLKRGIIGCGARVGIVGGGLAGVTAAAALTQKLAKVTLFEQRDRNFSLQRQTAIRFVHPTINFWPEMELNPSTDLPLLGWTADICANVIKQIEWQWSQFEGQLVNLHRPCSVLPLQRGPAEIRFLDGGGKEVAIQYDAVIIATGFGLEEALNGTVAPSYWDNVDLVRVGQSPATFLISGAGDGGILEVLRLVYPEFDFGRLTVKMARMLDKTAVRNDVKSAEEALSLDRLICREMQCTYGGVYVIPASNAAQ